jgi:hypothetical protein
MLLKALTRWRSVAHNKYQWNCSFKKWPSLAVQLEWCSQCSGTNAVCHCPANLHFCIHIHASGSVWMWQAEMTIKQGCNFRRRCTRNAHHRIPYKITPSCTIQTQRICLEVTSACQRILKFGPLRSIEVRKKIPSMLVILGIGLCAEIDELCWNHLSECHPTCVIWNGERKTDRVGDTVTT